MSNQNLSWAAVIGFAVVNGTWAAIMVPSARGAIACAVSLVIGGCLGLTLIALNTREDT